MIFRRLFSMIKFNVRFLAVTLAMALAAVATLAQGNAVYSSLPTSGTPNLPSLGYQATQTAEFGDNVFLAGTDRRAGSATVYMSDWAKNSTYPSMPSAGFVHPITFSIYSVDHSGPVPTRGSQLGTVTQSFLIPWRPEADPTCSGDRWRAGNGNCYSGYGFTIKFDLRGLNLTMPDDLIFGVAYNTNTWGYNPIGLPGPYESLNVGLLNMAPTVGVDVEADAIFWNTATPGNYTDGGLGGVNIFRRDDNWSPYRPTVELAAYTVATSAGACKNGGWQTLARADASTFKNQGDCVSYASNGR
jgi:hypothetical protein